MKAVLNLTKIIIMIFYYTYRFFFQMYCNARNFITFKIFKTQYSEFPKINGIVIRSGSGQLNLGKNIKINSSLTENPVGLTNKCLFYISGNASVSIGDNVSISNSLFYSINNIYVCDDVLIGGGCQILDNDFHSINYNDRILEGDKKVVSSPIYIRKGAFIGTSSIILKGVTIGERSVVAAGSVITKSIPNDEIWGGNPAYFIKKLN